MRTAIFAALSAATMICSAPAAANGLRAELRGGVAWVDGTATVPGDTSETVGVALGYDMDLSEGLFIGAEAVADTDFDLSDPVLGLNARFGTQLTGGTKVFVTGGWAHETTFDTDDALVGGGLEVPFSDRAFVSLQYQHYLDTEANRVTVGAGLKF